MSGTPSLRTGLMAGALLAVGVVCAVALTADVRAAMYVLAGALAVLGLVRLWAPPGTAWEVRSRPFDVVLLLGGALAIGLLAPWGNAVLPAGA